MLTIILDSAPGKKFPLSASCAVRHVWHTSAVMSNQPDIIVLFSGGLDSILAAKVLERQGLSVRCIHFITPFFGSAKAVPYWRKVYGLDIVSQDVGEEFAQMLRQRPEHGFGKVMNPCVDCKILLLRKARLYMESVGAKGLATGEVLGQRPMSQRRDTLHLIMRDAGVSGILLRPLCATHLPVTQMEESGLVDRSRLLSFSGRGRRDQLDLAAELGVTDIPTPGGGCRLTEKENARRYWTVLTLLPEAGDRDFTLANLGRQFWHHDGDNHYWLCIGRNSADNDKLAAAMQPDDMLLRLRDLAGPMALARSGADWPRHVLESAAAHAASYAPKAVAAGGPVAVRARQGQAEGDAAFEMDVTPQRQGEAWGEALWDDVKAVIRAEAKDRLAATLHGKHKPGPDDAE